MKYRIQYVTMGDRMGGQSDGARLLDETEDESEAYRLYGFHCETQPPPCSWGWVELVTVLEKSYKYVVPTDTVPA